MSELPEHEKLAKIKDQSQAIGEFLEWLNEEGIVLSVWRGDRLEHLVPDPQPIEKRLAAYFGIDLDALEDEKRELLEEQRALTRKADGDADNERFPSHVATPVDLGEAGRRRRQYTPGPGDPDE